METSGNRTALGVSADVAQIVGNRLRRARESIGRSTSALSAKIKVREHYLVAIEDGQWNELPPGLNGRGLVRIYARELAVSVPELDQAANQSVMPAEHDAQAPYQLGQKKDSTSDRDVAGVRVVAEQPSHAHRTVEPPVRTNTLHSVARTSSRGADTVVLPEVKRVSSNTGGHKIIESTPEEEPLDVITPDVASILGINLDTLGQLQMAAPTTTSQKEPLTGQVYANAKVDAPAPINLESVLPNVSLDIPPVSATVESAQRTIESTPSVSLPVVESVVVPAAVSVKIPTEIALAETPAVEVKTEISEPVRASESATVVQKHESHSHKKSGKKHNKNRHESRPAAVEPIAEQVQVESLQAATPSIEQTAVETIAALSTVEPSQTSDSAATHNALAPTTTHTEPMAPVTEPNFEENSKPSLGVDAAQAYLRSHAEETASEVREATTAKSSANGFRWAVGILAACVGVLIVSRAFLGTSNNGPGTESVESAASSESISTATENPGGGNAEAAGAASDPQTTPVDEPNAGASDATQSSNAATAVDSATTPPTVAQNPTSNPVSVAPSAAAPATDVNAVSTSSEAAAATEAAAADEATQDAGPATGTVQPTTGNAAATLILSEPIEIQVTSDGKRVFSGKYDGGKLEIKFNKRAEIFVQDGSKARLKYAGWEHGALGQAGRKRRIVLNAESFSGSGN